MTQNYEPIEITENTPEPTEEGTYLLTSPRTGAVLNVFDHDSTLPFGWSSFEDSDNWNGIREDNIGYNIQSLAAHDAQIRAEALTLSKSDRMAAYDVFDGKVVLPADFDPEDIDVEPFHIDPIIRSIFNTVAEHRKEQQQ